MPKYPELENLISKSEMITKLNLRVEFEETGEPFSGQYHVVDCDNDTHMTIFVLLEDISNPIGLFYTPIDDVDIDRELDQYRYLLEANCETMQGHFAITKDDDNIIYQASSTLRDLTVQKFEDIFIELEDAYETYREEFLGLTDTDIDNDD